MNKTEMAKLLTTINQYTGRTFDAMTIEAWHLAIGDLDYQDCVEAVIEFVRTNTGYLQIAHITTGALARRNHRNAQQRAADAALKELAERAEGIGGERGPVENRSADIAALVDQVRSVLPKGDRKNLRYQDKTLQRYQPRAADIPNPDFKGFGPVPVPGDNESGNPS